MAVCLAPDLGTRDGDGADGTSLRVARELVDRGGGGSVTAVAVDVDVDVPGIVRPGAGAVRRALALGADRALLVSGGGRVRRGLAAAKVLAAALRTLAPNLVVAGTERTDGALLATPVHQLAELLGMPSLTHAVALSVVGAELHAAVRNGAGVDEVRCPLPVLVTVHPGAGVALAGALRPTFTELLAARSKPVDRLSPAALGLAEADLGPVDPEPMGAAPAPASVGGARLMIRDGDAAYEAAIGILESLEILSW